MSNSIFHQISFRGPIVTINIHSYHLEYHNQNGRKNNHFATWRNNFELMTINIIEKAEKRRMNNEEKSS